jgi:ferric-dicitrate binding protein FerR (iron transport regulator)
MKRITAVGCGLAVGAVLMLQSSAAMPATRAGEVRALVARAYIVRPAEGRKWNKQEAAQSDEVQWRDILRTDRGGRIRVALDDGSVLNVGSLSQIQVIQHDAARQRTWIHLAYGKMRAEVVRLSQPRGSFEVRTNVAVAGVVGTSFSVSISPEKHTIVVALERDVRVRNVDPKVRGEVVLKPGEFTHVGPGDPPAPPAKAPPEMLREAKEELDIPG